VPNYFAATGEPRYEAPSFRRSNAFAATAREVAAVRERVGINEVHNFGKYRVTGPQARAWLERVMAGRIPKPGRLSLTPMLSEKGKLIGDFTISCLGPETYQLTASYGAQDIHTRWFERHAIEGARVENVSDTLNGFQIAGPRARDVLAKVTRSDVSDMRFLDVRRLTLGMIDCTVQRVSYTGDLGYEIYCHPMEQRHLWHVLWEAGAEFGMAPFGMRAMMSLRLDKLFGSWMAEFSPDYTPKETGLARFMHWERDFIGKAAAQADAPMRMLCAFEVQADDADVVAYEPIFAGEDVVGFCTSGGFSHHTGKSIAQGFLPTDMATDGALFDIEILGERRAATVFSTPLFDADGARMRG
ncbi:MAG: aminomethyltransferase family protein, partial [Pseudomonadota bacterium]